MLQNAPTMALALVPGGQAAALAAMGITTGGQSYQKDMAINRGHWTSLLHGVSDATIEVGTEMGPLHGLVDNIKAGTPLFTTLLKNAWQENKGEQVATALQDMNDWAVNDVNKGKTFVDYLKERPEAAAQTAIATLIGTVGNVAILHTIQTAADNASGTDRQAQVAEQHAQVLETMQATMQASKLLEHSPDTLRSYAQDLADEGVPTVYVDSAKLVEAGVDLQALAQVMPSVAAQLDQVQTGGDLVIPTGELLTNTIGTEFAQSLIDHGRTDVDGMSRAEAKVYMDQKGDQINAEIERVLAAKENDAEFKAGRDQVQAQILTQLNEVKRFTPIREHYGANVKKELTKWRDDIVAGSARLDHGIENAAGWARKFVSSAALTYNVISALMQPLGITQSFARVGTKWVGMGLGQYLSGPVEATRMVQGKSEYMTNRTRTMFRDINELRNRVQGQTTGRELMGRYGYYLTMHFQMMVDVPTWIGAYEKGLAEGHTDDVAIALADQSVKDSQGGGEEVDQSGITRGGPMIKLFTAFYDFMNTQANVLYLKNATATSKADKFMHMAAVGLVTPVLAAALRDALIAGDSGDWDDWEKVLKKMLTEGLSNLIGMVAFGREFASVAKALTGEDRGVGYSGPTGLRVIPDAYKLAKQVSQGELDDAFRKSFITSVGDVAGIPAVQINRTINGIKALDEGKTSNPAAVLTGYQEPH